jgi:Guanyl-specific ribonuclease Sa
MWQGGIAKRHRGIGRIREPGADSASAGRERYTHRIRRARDRRAGRRHEGTVAGGSSRNTAADQSGGPFPFGEDGVLFRNSALLLPGHPRGYYHTYTVRTPGMTDRGQRRIICGRPRRQTGDCYYTDDYYASFKRIAE